MEGLETGKDKIQKICDSLRRETLEPAKQEAREIIENAKLQADEVVREAKEKEKQILAAADAEIQEKKKVFESSLSLACRQGIEFLKQKIEEQIFHDQLAASISKEMSDPKIIGELISSFMKSLEERGVEEDLAVVIPKQITQKKISEFLASKFLDRLKQEPFEIGDFSGGVQIKLKDLKITIDISDQVVRELIANYIRRDFRDLVFKV